MPAYSIDSLMQKAYGEFPVSRRRPVIGITANHSDIDVSLRDAYHKQVVAAGGVPVIIPPVTDADVIINTLEGLDGVILSGGGDYNPLWCGEEPSPLLHGINAVRDSAELLLTRLAFNRQIPLLGICRGMQTLAMALGGHVAQDISEAVKRWPVGRNTSRPVKHSQDAARGEATHTVTLAPCSTLYNIYCPDKKTGSALTIDVNSFHHQVVDEPGERFRAVAWSTDGLIEAMESSERKAVMGVQWHPEWLADGLPVFRWLVEEAETFRRAKILHTKVITLDTHCDTPMFFRQGVDFTKRDPRILVDLHKMTEGRQDATIMVCYLPQPAGSLDGMSGGRSFRDVIDFPFDSPKQYADFIFDEIERIVLRKPDYIAFARTEEDILCNKAEGKKTIMLGIENGLAIEHDISNIKHFADCGVVYITLCHNGDNLICDSARNSDSTHGGVSEFGERVIMEMNRLGIMVDMSHAGEKSFYDALEISGVPIVCSHSNCRALCDNPRNLTDDQMRALARKGGVAHITFYHGFLKSPGTVLAGSANILTETDILDGIAHLEHAISVMGIDHVGIGTDFDGDGGVAGMADSSEVINFTKHLLRKRYSDEDIRKIWGGNWLRTMKEIRKSQRPIL